MDDHARQAARALIINHGGLETTHYKDSIDDDLDWFASRLQAQQPIFKTLEPTRQAALLDMAFDLGLIGLVKLKPLWAAINAYNWNGAAESILESKWAMQAGIRAVDDARIMRMGKI